MFNNLSAYPKNIEENISCKENVMTMSSIDINNLSINMKKRLCTVSNHGEINNARKEILKEFNIHPNSARVHLISISAEKLYKKGEYDAAVLKISEYIEEYLILHIINTVPLKYFNQDFSGLPLGTQLYEKTLKVDTECLCGALEHLIFYYAYSQKEFEIIQFLDKIKNIIDSVMWNEKIILCKMAVKGIINEDITAAKKEISNKGDILKINDVELLTVCLYVFRDELSDSETISVIDKIM